MIIHWFLYVIIHNLIKFYSSIRNFLYYILCFDIYRRYSIAKIKNASKSIRKLPIHLGIILGEDTFSFNDLANMILWSSIMDINCLSIYDLYGKFAILTRENNILFYI